MTKSQRIFIDEIELYHPVKSICFSRKLVNELCQDALRGRDFSIIPLLVFLLKAEIRCLDIVKAIREAPEADTMVQAIANHTEYLKAELKPVAMLKAVKVMGAELVKAVMEEERSPQIVEPFLESLDIERGVIDISDLLEKALWYHPEWLRKMFEKGADLQTCKQNPLSVVLGREYTQHCVKLEMIRLLMEHGAPLPNDIPHSFILHEVVKCTLKCEKGVDTLNMVCAEFDYTCQEVCDEEGKTPWHLALNAKRKRISIDICKVLSKYPIDPSKKDKNGKRADLGKSADKDERVKILRAREAEMEVASSGGAKFSRGTRGKKIAAERIEETTKLAESFQSFTGEALPGIDYKSHQHKILKGHNPTCVTFDQSRVEVPINTTGVKEGVRIEPISVGSTFWTDITEEECEKEDNTSDSDLKQTDDMLLTDMQELTEEPRSCNDREDNIESHSSDSEQDGHTNRTLWTVEQSKKLEKKLQRRKNRHIAEIFHAKMAMLSQGEFVGNTKRCKSVTATKGVELYEARLNKKMRIIWQIIPKSCPGKQSVYRQIIRAWDVVFNHDKIHHCVETILNDKECKATTTLKSKLKSTAAGASHVHKHKRKPAAFKVEQDTEEDKDDDIHSKFRKKRRSKP